VNPAALIPVTHPGDLRQDRVGQLVKRVLDGMTSDETRRGYSHALEMFLEFCDREGNPTLGRAGRELPGRAGRGREVVLHGGSSPSGHQSSDPGGGQGRVDGARNRRCRQRCERCTAARKPHRQVAHPGAGVGTAFAPGSGTPQGQTRLCHPGSPARLWAAPDGAGFRGEGRSHRSAGEPLGAGRHCGKGKSGSFGGRPRLGQSSDRRLDHRGRRYPGEDLSRGAQGGQSLG
jgi:hypothetical protein